MSVTVINDRGMPIGCDSCSLPASTAWTDTLGKQHYACQTHNPMSLPAALPLNFTSQTICHACGQPVHIGTRTY